MWPPWLQRVALVLDETGGFGITAAHVDAILGCLWHC